LLEEAELPITKFSGKNFISAMAIFFVIVGKFVRCKDGKKTA
jgi:hypothetical protein